MGKRGLAPQEKINIKWSANFAYAIGLLVTDGNLSSDGRHMSFVSKDIQQINNFLKCVNISVKIGKTTSGYDGNFSHRVQFGDVIFYKFLESIGIHPKKSTTIGPVLINRKYFFDYLRGCFDGDGCFYSYWDKRWKSSHMFYLEFVSASQKHIEWLQGEINNFLGVSGYITFSKVKTTYKLKFAKKEALVIIKKMYYNPSVVCLSRKKLKIEKALKIEENQQKKYSK
jgi:intein-encoded DNA endonuclease-like protein